MEKINFKSICAGLITYFLFFLLSVILHMLFFAVSLLAPVIIPNIEFQIAMLEINQYPIDIVGILISIPSGYITEKISNNKSYINCWIVGIVIFLYFSWNVTSFTFLLLFVPATLFGGYLYHRKVIN